MHFLKENVYRAICIIIFILLWELVAYLYDSPFFPTPVEVFKSLLSLLKYGKNYNQILITMFRVLIAMPIAMLIGGIIGILPQYFKPAKYFVESVIFPLFQSIPPISWILLFSIWLGLSPINPIIAASITALPYVIIPISQGIKELDKNLIELGLSFTKKKVKILKKIVIPLLYPYFFTALRSSFGFMWRIMVVVELFLAVNGIGYMAVIAREAYNVSRVLAWSICVSIIMTFFEYVVFNYIEKKTVKKEKE